MSSTTPGPCPYKYSSYGLKLGERVVNEGEGENTGEGREPIAFGSTRTRNTDVEQFNSSKVACAKLKVDDIAF